MPKHTASSETREIAFYYPGPTWSTGDWIKSLILFFDGIGLLVPRYLKGKPELDDPAIAIPLSERGLLHILEPKAIVGKEETEKLAAAMSNIIASGALDNLPKDTEFHEISSSRLGFYGDDKLAEEIFRQLQERKLARKSENGVSIPMHPMARYLILTLLAQILRAHGNDLGAELSPATDRPEVVAALNKLLSLPNLPSSGHVVSLDLETVGVDLRLVPMDEVLSFRKDHYEEHRKYVTSVRRFVRDLSLTPQRERESALEDREEELRDLVADIRKVSRKAWKRPASFALTMAGAFWTLSTGDLLGAILGAGSALLGAGPKQHVEIGAYSYIFRAAHSLY